MEYRNRVEYFEMWLRKILSWQIKSRISVKICEKIDIRNYILSYIQIIVECNVSVTTGLKKLEWKNIGLRSEDCYSRNMRYALDKVFGFTSKRSSD